MNHQLQLTRNNEEGPPENSKSLLNQDCQPSHDRTQEQPQVVEKVKPPTSERNHAPKRKAHASDLREIVDPDSFKRPQSSSKSTTTGERISVRLSSSRSHQVGETGSPEGKASPRGTTTKKKVARVRKCEKVTDNHQTLPTTNNQPPTNSSTNSPLELNRSNPGVVSSGVGTTDLDSSPKPATQSNPVSHQHPKPVTYLSKPEPLSSEETQNSLVQLTRSLIQSALIELRNNSEANLFQQPGTLSRAHTEPLYSNPRTQFRGKEKPNSGALTTFQRNESNSSLSLQDLFSAPRTPQISTTNKQSSPYAIQWVNLAPRTLPIKMVPALFPGRGKSSNPVLINSASSEDALTR